MAGQGPQGRRVGSQLSCARCGTQVRIEQAGAGPLECCAEPLQGAAAPAAPRGERRVHCAQCGGQLAVERDGGGSLQCCHEQMVQL